jgi:hypothetical protein
MKQISHNLNYPVHHLEDLFFPLFERNYINESFRVTIGSDHHIWFVYEYGKCIAFFVHSLLILVHMVDYICMYDISLTF